MMALRDYLSARILFDKSLLQPACILANTCIEKELKTCLIAMGGEKKIRKLGHDSLMLFKELKRLDPIRCALINEEFIKALSSIYKSRYHDGLQIGYRYVIAKKKFLAELDFTYILLTKATRKPSQYAKDSLNPFERMQESLNVDLYKDNFVLNNATKVELLNGGDLVTEFFINPNHQVYEVFYNIELDANPTKFIYDNTPIIFDINGDYSFKLANEKYSNLIVSAV